MRLAKIAIAAFAILIHNTEPSGAITIEEEICLRGEKITESNYFVNTSKEFNEEQYSACKIAFDETQKAVYLYHLARALEKLRRFDEAEKIHNELISIGYHQSYVRLAYFNWFEHKTGFKRNLSIIFDLLNKAANQGNSEAHFTLGYFKYLDFSASENDDYNIWDVVRHYERSANLGNAEAMYHLGFIYRNGDRYNINVDNEEAYKWFLLAEKNGYEDASAMTEYYRFSIEHGFVDMSSSTLNKIARIADDAYELIVDNKEEIAISLLTITSAIILDDFITPDEQCFHPDGNCSDWALPRHKDLFETIKRYSPPSRVCEREEQMANFVGGITRQVAWASAGVLSVVLTGEENEIFVDIDEIQSALNADGWC